MGQTDYSAPSNAYAGQIANDAVREVRSYRASVEHAFGRFVAASSGNSKLPTANTDEILGVSVREHVFDPGRLVDKTNNNVPADAQHAVLERGEIWVEVEVAVAAGDDVFVRFADGVADTALVKKGIVRNDDDTYTALKLPGAKVKVGASAGGRALIAWDRHLNDTVSAQDARVRRITASAGNETSDARDVTAQVIDGLGRKVLDQPKVKIESYAPTAAKGVISDASTPIGTNNLSSISITNSKFSFSIRTPTNTGAFGFKVSDDQAETVRVVMTVVGGYPAAPLEMDLAFT